MSSSSNYSEEALIKGLKKNKRKYQEMVYQKYASTMYAICLTYADSREEAKDILQEGFLKVFTKINTFQNTGSFGGWIRKIITNTALDAYRKNARKRKDLVLNDEIYSDDERVDNHILEEINSKSLIQKISSLPQGARVVFNLYAVEGYSHKEIAEKLDISVGTSKSQFNRARSLLKQKINNSEI